MAESEQLPDLSRKPVLEGHLVTLRPVTRADAAALLSLMADAEVAVLTGSVHTRAEAEEVGWTLAELEEVYGRWATARDRTVWAVVERATDRVVGESVLHELDVDNAACGFRIWLSGARDRGLGTEATRLTLRHAFADQHLHRVELEVLATNPRARHVYENVGFRHEGRRRDALRFEDGWVDVEVMAMLADDYAAHRPGAG